jgi:hypothetical protein
LTSVIKWRIKMALKINNLYKHGKSNLSESAKASNPSLSA